VAVAVLLVAGGAATAGWWFFGRSTGPRADLLLHKVRYEKMEQTIVERGTLNAAENHDIVCRLKARSQGSTVASSIRWVIDDGMQVEAGDKLIELDDSALQDLLKTQRITVDQKRSDWIVAEEDYKSTLIGNEADIAQAKLDLDVARIDLEQYQNALYLQQKKDVESRLTLAQNDLEMWRERASWSKRMSEPGRRYTTVAQAEDDQARMRVARLSLRDTEARLEMLSRVQEGEAALHALREAKDEEAKRRAADQLEKALRKLRQPLK
jgi:multidrug efflux pump subunit AcrA (membrane-fusion protein)